MDEPKDMVLPIKGMHCGACTILVRETLTEELGVDAEADLGRHELVVKGFRGTRDEFMAQGNRVLGPLGYHLEDRPLSPWRDLALGGTGALVLLGILALVQGLGVIPIAGADGLGPASAVILGVLASISTCFALVGGLLVSFGASMRDRPPHYRRLSMALFHGGRLGGFFLLGGLLGLAGDMMQISYEATVALLALASLVMVFSGLQFLGLLRVPAGKGHLARQISKLSKSSGPLVGLLLGLLTFVLPCGFTQSMQFQALAAGGFWGGATLMLAFALGTLPVLGLVTLGLEKGLHSRYAGAVGKGAGFLILALGLFQTYNVLVSLGWVTPLFF